MNRRGFFGMFVTPFLARTFLRNHPVPVRPDGLGAIIAKLRENPGQWYASGDEWLKTWENVTDSPQPNHIVISADHAQWGRDIGIW